MRVARAVFAAQDPAAIDAGVFHNDVIAVGNADTLFAHEAAFRDRAATLREVSSFAPGSTLAMTFLLPLEMADPDIRPGLEMAEKGARASGTPFISFFTPDAMMAFALENGFHDARHISAAALTERYFANRTDGLHPPRNAEELLIATT